MNNAVFYLVKLPLSAISALFLFLTTIHLIDSFYRHGAFKAFRVNFLNYAELFIQPEKMEAPLM